MYRQLYQLPAYFGTVALSLIGWKNPVVYLHGTVFRTTFIASRSHQLIFHLRVVPYPGRSIADPLKVINRYPEGRLAIRMVSEFRIFVQRPPDGE